MDINYLLALQNLRDATGGVLNTFFEYITKLGETSVIVFFVGLVYWGLNKKQGIFLMFSLYTNRIINGFIKITACVYRPWIRDARITPVPDDMNYEALAKKARYFKKDEKGRKASSGRLLCADRSGA